MIGEASHFQDCTNYFRYRLNENRECYAIDLDTFDGNFFNLGLKITIIVVLVLCLIPLLLSFIFEKIKHSVTIDEITDFCKKNNNQIENKIIFTFEMNNSLIKLRMTDK